MHLNILNYLNNTCLLNFDFLHEEEAIVSSSDLHKLNIKQYRSSVKILLTELLKTDFRMATGTATEVSQ